MSIGEPEGPAVAIAMKGYPRLSETFIAQELLGLQRLGLSFAIWSLRHPTDSARHLMHREITAPLHYLPEYLHDDWPRVLRGIARAFARPSMFRLLGAFLRDLARDRTRNRLRRFGQACVMARELPPGTRHLHVHYLHTPASVIRYAALSRGLTWSFSAHAKDIWTTPDWEKREKIADARWGVTCTRDGHAELARLAGRPDKVALLYHGLDLSRFPPPPEARSSRDGSDPNDPLCFITIGRAVAKKGFDDLLAALAILPTDMNWRLVHIGGGEMLAALKAQAEMLGLAARIEWRGPQAQDAVIAALREADLFVLPSKQAENGDRDGLPNVVMEAASQALPIVATDFAGIPEFVQHGRDGLLIRPGDVSALAKALEGLSRDPQWRAKLGAAAFDRLRTEFSAQAGLERVHRALAAAVARKDGGAP
jgi:glycosyltransferase involved in cell wall biosynthesis